MSIKITKKSPPMLLLLLPYSASMEALKKPIETPKFYLYQDILGLDHWFQKKKHTQQRPSQIE